MAEKKSDSTILEKIQGLKELFKFGGEIVPFVEELFAFLKDVLPLMDKVSSSLHETTANMPKAQERILQASQAAEAASQEIMDKLDVINQRLNDLAEKIKKKNSDETLQKVINETQNDTFEIIYALQFQDITGQQLAHAHQILQAIFERFNRLFEAIKSLDIDDNLKDIFFGNIAHLMDDSELKTIQDASEDTIRNEGVSQDDIDKLFKNQ